MSDSVFQDSEGVSKSRALTRLLKVARGVGVQALVPVLTLFVFVSKLPTESMPPELMAILPWLESLGMSAFGVLLDRATDQSVTDEELREEIKQHIDISRAEQEIADRTLQRNFARLMEKEARTFRLIIEKIDFSTREIIVQQLDQHNLLKRDIRVGFLAVRADIHQLSTDMDSGFSELRTQVAETEKNLGDELANFQRTMLSPRYPVALVDQEIESGVEKLRKSRFFPGFDVVKPSMTLIESLEDGELSGGSDEVKSRALAWCVRFLAPSGNFDELEIHLAKASDWGNGSEIQVAKAFLCAKQGDIIDALGILDDFHSPLSRTAALMIKVIHDGAEEAVDWMKGAGIEVKDLDQDGKFILLTHLLLLSRWEAARECLEMITDEDLKAAPALHSMVAMTHLLDTVPTEFRNLVLTQLPLGMRSFPLASDIDGINARWVAHDHFDRAARAAEQLDCVEAAENYDEYAIWLQLADPSESNEGRHRLKRKLRSERTALRYVQLGLEYGIAVDTDLVERRIEQQITLRGEITLDGARARMALAFDSSDPAEFAAYVSTHFNELSRFFDQKYLLMLQSELLMEAGLHSRAREILDILQEEGISEDETGRLRQTFSKVSNADAAENLTSRFEQTDSLIDLMALVGELERVGNWEQLCIYGDTLYERTTSLRDGERFARALSNTHRYQQLVEFLQTNKALLGQSRNLQMLYSWALYFEGSLLEARSELAKLGDIENDENYRALQVNLSISMGDWESLLAFVASELKIKDQRSASELIGIAQLAIALDSGGAQELLHAAATKGEEDPQVLFSCYILASQTGIEIDDEISGWLQRAAALSGDEGPVQRMTLEDVLERKPEWDRRESDTWELLRSGDIPMFLAATSLNKYLIDQQLIPAFANLSETDPRRRAVIPAYSGNRSQTSFEIGGVIGLEATALLNLSYLNLLQITVEAFSTIYVPHSTLPWLFEERQHAPFHQPTRIEDARRLIQLLANGRIERFSPRTVPNSDLSNQVGEELAALLSEAEEASRIEDSQNLVVRSAPVHHLGSLMREEANLSDYASLLVSCGSIISKLRQQGHITAKEEKLAHAYLHLQERGWSQEPEIEDGAVLYLDSLTIFYFLHLSILEKLKPAGFRSVVSDRALSDANNLIAYERLSGNILHALDQIRTVLAAGIETGKIKVGRRQYFPDLDDHLVVEHPTRDLLSLAGSCEAVIVDDRFLNRHSFIENNASRAPIMSSLDLLDAFVSADLITTEEQWEHKTMLRRGGHLFVPIDIDELMFHLELSGVHDGKVLETAELKAIREYTLKVRMSGWLQFPKEQLWLDTLINVFIEALRGLWKSDADLETIGARSNWILEQLDVRGWAHSFSQEEADRFVKIGRRMPVLRLLLPINNVPEEVNDAYWGWVESRIIAPIKEGYPELYSWIVERARSTVDIVTNKGLDELGPM